MTVSTVRKDYASGTLVWIKDEDDVWKAGEVFGAADHSESELIVKTATGEPITIRISDPIHLRNVDEYSSSGLTVLDDLTQLTHLHEPAVLHSLQMRFDIDKIYSFCGPIVIAVNPFKRIPKLYDLETLKSFVQPKKHNASPHVWSTANAAFRGICDQQESQTILISGESGAGKTETTKIVMKFLALAGAGEDGGMTEVERQVLESNPFLEAFGNSRTLRNDNSSRFGKFIELQFMPSSRGVHNVKKASKEGVAQSASRLCGARIQTYLLEKVRVTDQQEGERNFHIFYQCCAAFRRQGAMYQYPDLLKGREEYQSAQPWELDLSAFGDCNEFVYLTRSSCCTLDGVDDAEEFERTVFAMQTMGNSLEEVGDILNAIAVVLHLGNIAFCAPKGNSEGSMVNRGEGGFGKLAGLLGVDASSFEDSICTKIIKTAGEQVRSSNSIRVATDHRDSLARQIYGLTFNHIVDNTNRSIGYRKDVNLYCGVLDIFGFEKLEKH